MRLFLIAVVVVVLASFSLGQINYGEVTGTVRDVQSLPISKAVVLFKALSTGATRAVVTNEDGLFSAAALPPVEYEITTQASGFADVTQRLRVEVGERLAIAVSMKVGPVKEGVQVNAGADILRPTDASVGEVVERKSVPELPLNGRMLIDLVSRGARRVRRADRRNESAVLEAGTALGDRHWGQPSQCQFLSAGWRDQHRPHLQHAEFQSFARRSHGIPGGDEQLHRRYGRCRRGPDQHCHQKRDEPLSRNRV